MSIRPSQVITVSNRSETCDNVDEYPIEDSKSIHKSRSGKESHKNYPFYYEKREFSREKSRSNSRDATKRNFSHKPDSRKPFTAKATPENSPSRGNKHSYKNEGFTSSNGLMTNSRESRLLIYKHSHDESRFTRLLSKLERDDERDKPIHILRQLKEILLQPENYKLASQHYSELTKSFENLLQNRNQADIQKELTYCIVTLGAALDGDCKNYFEWLFSLLSNTTSLEVRIIIFQIVLEVLRLDEESNKLANFIPMINSQAQTALENVETHEGLMAVVDVILHIARVQPSIFSSNFRDTVDILVGWHIDSSPNLPHVGEISNALVALHDFWVMDIGFTVTLMTQFLEDMDSYGEELANVPSPDGTIEEEFEEQHNIDECLSKIDGLIRVFSTVLKSLGRDGCPAENPGVSWDFIVRGLKGLFKCMNMVVHWSYEEALLTSAHECAALLLTNAQNQGNKALSVMVNYLTKLLDQCPSSLSTPHLLSILNLLRTFVHEVGSHMPITFINQLFSPSSLVHKLKLMPTPKINQGVIQLYHAALGLKNVPILEETYKAILLDLQAAGSLLLSNEDFVLLAETHVKHKYEDREMAKVAFLANLSILSELATIKHSLIGMWALKPSLFDLLSLHLQPSNYKLIIEYPEVHYALLYTFYSHCSRHGHFISSSSLINTVSSPQFLSSPQITRPTSKHFAKEMFFLSSLLSKKELGHNTRYLLLAWSLELVESLQHNTNKLCHNMEFFGLAQALVNHCFLADAVTCKTSCAALQTLLKYASTSLPGKLLDRCYEACIVKFSDSNSSIRSSFFSLFTFLPLDIITSNSAFIINSTRDITMPKEECLDQDVWMARHCYLNRPPTPTFEANAFKIITSYILAGNKPKSENWALQLFYGCTTNGSSSSSARGSSSINLATTEETMRRLLPHSQNLGTFWATWEVAQFCVLQKLRTPLGKPQDTFTTIEGAIKNYAKNIFLPSKKVSKEEKLDEITRIRLLLNLTEHLEKLMYNAYEGTAIALYTPPKAVRTFFRTNKGTCLEWVSRIRMAIILVALKTGQMANVVRQGFQLLHEMAENNLAQSPDFEHLLLYVVQALKELGSSESILGLYLWARDHVGQKFTWIKAAVDHSSGRFEDAAYEYNCVLQAMAQDQDSATHGIQDSFMENTFDKSFPKINDDLRVSQAKVMKRPDPCGSPDMQVQGYMMHQVMECYLKLGNFSEALHWAEQEQELCSKQNGHHHFYNVDELDYLKSLSSFESYQKTSKLEVRDPSSDCSSWDGIMIQEEMKVLKKVAKVLNSGKPNYEEIRDFGETMKGSNLHLQQVLKASCDDWPPLIDPNHAAFYLATNSFANIYQKGKKVLPTLLKDGLKLEATDYNGAIMNHALFWSNTWQLLQHREHRSHLGPFADLQLVGARLARKQQNIKLAQKLIHKCVNVIVGLHRSNGILSPTSNSPTLSSLKETLMATTHLSASDRLTCLQREGAKLLHCCGEIQGSIGLLLSSISSILASGGSNEMKQLNGKTMEQATLYQLNAKSLLTLTKYLQQDSHYLNSLLKNENAENPNFAATLQNLLSFASAEIETYNHSSLEPFFEDGKNIPENERCLGILFQAAVTQAPNLAKPWLALASWSYRWGRKAVDAAASAGYVELSKETQEEILRVLPWELNEMEKQNLFHAIGQASFSEADWNEGNMCTIFEGEDTPTISHLLAACPWLEQETGSPELIHKILEIRRSVLQSTYRYYEVAARAYFRFLQISSQNEDEKHDDDNVTATLRLLRIIVKHASELRPTLEKGLAHTPTAPWRGIIPQLFSRLNHPELYVRQSISDLLCRVAQASPHLIVFPAVVGSLTLSTHDRFQDTSSGLLKSCLTKKESGGGGIGSTQHSEDEDVDPSNEEEEDTAQQQQRQAMQNCFAALVTTLGNQDARTIAQVKVLVQELRRITLLWDELWLGTLTLHHSDTHRRINTLEDEIRKVQANTSLKPEEKSKLIKDKHYVFVKPLVFIWEQLQSITSQTPETPHEQRFQDMFSKQIAETLEKIRNPEDPTKPHHVWTLYKQLHQKLQHECGGSGGNRGQLVMEEISPKLAILQDTEIPMPGAGGAGVRIQAIHPTVSVLPTKTKPKKLAFVGSDGRKYTFLFKGLEDLHLDQRIMQFLAIVNDMLAKSRKNGKGMIYKARHYSVTPLGPRSGLIQWVDRATPLFGLYKRWQQRESAAQTLKPSQNASGGAVPGPILRPSEIYYNKLSPLLKEKGVSNLENRKEWPLSVQLQVLRELMEETPKDLLAKELWCSSTSPLEWWQVSQTYCRSTAVMSVIGYIIGLGDRHLDNLLVDLTTGEMIHIDYNVCFEKGKNLRVPEKVPFRMTPNIETALGLTGVEGLFRVSCEAVLRVMRRGRESLMTLLEAFVYDPLVEWTPGGVEGGYPGAAYGGTHPCRGARQAMERDLVCRLFTIRLAEMRAAWLHNKSELVNTMSQLQKEIENWQAAQVNLHSAERELQEVCHQKALLDEALANPLHPLYSLPKRYKEFVRIKTSLLTAEEAITEKINECAKWQSHHLEALDCVCGPKLGHWLQEVGKYSNQPPDTFTVAPAVEFLHNSGKGQLVQQCESAENELNSALHEVHLGIRTCVETLSNYALIVMQFPPSFRQQNRSVTWQLLLSSLLRDFTERKCVEIETLLQNNCGQEALGLCSVHTAFGIYISLKTIINDVNSKLIAAIEYQHREGLVDVPLITAMSTEAKANVVHFIREHGATPAICMAASMLTTSIKRLLHLDKSMSNTLGEVERLGGEGSLEEMCSLIHSLHQHLKLLQDSIPDLSPQAKTAFHAVTCAHNVFTSLEELSLNFQNIILPETLKGIQAEDPSVAQMIERVNALVGPPGQVAALISNLEEDIHNTVMDMQTPRSDALRKANELRKELNDLLQGTDPQMLGLSSGQMLLMGFNGLFTKLDSDMASLLTALDILQPPSSWKKVDLFREALLFLPSALWVESTRELIGGIFLLRRLTAMQGVFSECCQMAGLLRLAPTCVPNTNDPDQLPDLKVLAADGGCKPIKAFMVHYLYKQLLGVSVQASISCLCSLLVEITGLDLEAEVTCCGADTRVTMEDLVKRSADLYCCRSARSCDTTALLSEVGSRFALLDSALKKEEAARRGEQNIQLLKNTLHRKQLQLAQFQWLFEDYLVPNGPGVISPRTTIMSEMRKNMQNLLALENHAASNLQKFLTLTASVEQRMKWASGANPTLVETREKFEAAIAEKTSSTNSLLSMAKELSNTSNAILHFEALRTYTTEARASEAALLAIIKRCREACRQAENCAPSVSSVEEKLLSLLPVGDADELTTEMLSSVTDKVSLASCKEKLEEQKLECFSYWDSAKKCVIILRNLLTEHHTLMSDIRNILRNLSKYEEQGNSGEMGPIQQFLILYKNFSENISGFVREVLSESTESLDLESLRSQLPVLSTAVSRVFDTLLQLAHDPALTTSQSDKVAAGDSLSSKVVSNSNTPAGVATLPRDPRTGKVVQERNTYATNVLKRVKHKLEGRDPDSNKKSSIAEQVDFIIKEATNLENLAVLYEGWTPWV